MNINCDFMILNIMMSLFLVLNCVFLCKSVI